MSFSSSPTTENLDRSRLITVAKNARTMFEGLPGLHFKFFTLDEKEERAVNLYVWGSMQAAEAPGSPEGLSRSTYGDGTQRSAGLGPPLPV